MSDPAEVAANRVALEITDTVYYHHLLDVAREVLEPIREALSEAIQVAATGTTGTTHDTISGVTKDEALDIMAQALLAVRPLIYSTEELDR
jgi:hypothetical protein